MKKNIKKVKKFQKPLICLIGILILLVGIAIGKIMNTSADEINYDYQSNNISYDSTNSNLNATNVKDAIDELYSKVGKCPNGIYCYVKNKSFEKAYTYDESTCITGDETGCVETTCYANGTCPVGTIIDYAVSSSDVVRFHVLHDNGTTITLQAQKNTVYNTAWYSGGNNQKKGPQTIMASLKTATDGWNNVKDITLADGMTEFNDGTSTNNSCTSISCSMLDNDSGYPYSTLGDNEFVGKNVKARMITMQEVLNTGCTTTKKTCSIYLYNFLMNSEDNCKMSGKCTNDTHTENGVLYNAGYWTMGTDKVNVSCAWAVDQEGRFINYGVDYTSVGARAVVVVNK